MILSDFEEIKKYIFHYRLDDTDLSFSQFLMVKKTDKIIAFGRIKEYVSCSELCSLGVIESERNKGVGKFLVRELIKKAKQPLYIVTIIPQYFEGLGFRVVTNYPSELNKKLNYCTSKLIVEERYVVMKHF